MLNSIRFIADKILRLWPLILIVCILSLTLGFFTMLPDDYENLGQSAVASSVFLNNLLSALTTKNYWNVSNNYKPLMHLWYVGVLVQLYVVLTLVFSFVEKWGKRAVKITTIAMAVLSVTFFLWPGISSGDKFYWIPFRAFELLAGAIVYFFAQNAKRIPRMHANIAFTGACVLIGVVICFGFPFVENIALLSVVLLTSAALWLAVSSDEAVPPYFRVVSKIGEASFSIYIIHQPIIAFTRYFYTAEIKGFVLAFVLLMTAGLSALLYCCVEKPLGAALKRHGLVKSSAVCICVSVFVMGAGLIIYKNAGVVRDVPELDVYRETAYRGMHAEYVDLPYKLNHDFETDKIHILVVGDSMARDWCNILAESPRSSEFEVSYVYHSEYGPKYRERTERADYIFYSCLGDSTEAIPDSLKGYSHLPNFYVVGVKNFGESNGQIYQRRFQKDYFESTVVLGKTNMNKDETYIEQNERQKVFWGSRYIDMIACVLNEDGSVPVFTDTRKYISADTIHLTQNGCIYYAKILDLSFIQ